MIELVIYSRDDCPFCHLLKHVLDDNNLIYRVVDLSDDATRVDFYAESGTQSVPQVYLIDDKHKPFKKHLGGWVDVKDNIGFLINALK